jgi:predicted regulator of Ras-like GTPase activity (Roadblock/LC7/MglB family)
MTARPPEAKRDLLETSFTPILRQIWSATESVLAAVFVDLEGECIDYVSSIDPFEAKVAGAHAFVLVDSIRRSHGKLGMQEPVSLSITGSARELWARRVSDDYVLVLVLLPGADHAQLRAMLARAGREFRAEVGAASPAWEPTAGVLEVIVRAAVGWPYAPAAYTDRGQRVLIADVLGRWIEPVDGPANEQAPLLVEDAGPGLVCFRVRTQEGQELTLVHDPSSDEWSARV